MVQYRIDGHITCLPQCSPFNRQSGNFVIFENPSALVSQFGNQRPKLIVACWSFCDEIRKVPVLCRLLVILHLLSPIYYAWFNQTTTSHASKLWMQQEGLAMLADLYLDALVLKVTRSFR